MKKNWKNNLTVLVISVLLAACSTDKHAEHADTYTCPMHPTVVSDRPSTCPVCGMDLVRKARAGEEVKITEDLARLIKSPNEVVTATIKTIKGEYKSMTVAFEATGIVTYDTRQVFTIPSRIGGRLEKVYLKYAYQSVQKGQKVADIYSPELLTAQRELLYLIENDAANQSLIEAAKNKLYLLGASEAQVADIVRTKEPVYTFSMYSAQNGYVVTDTEPAPVAPVTASSASSGMDAMGSGGQSSQTAVVSNNMNGSSSQLKRAGNYVSAGETLFKVVNTAALWVELNIPISKSGTVKQHDKVTLDFGDGNTRQAQVDFVQPFFSDGEEFLKIRVYVTGEGLRIGQLVRATFDLTTTETLWLPKQAVLDLGLDKIVFVKERETFLPKKVTVGIRTDGWVEIKQGLLSADDVAENAQYLVDSESFIKSK